MSALTPLTQALLDKARATGNTRIEALLTDGRAALPSVEELEAELGRDFVEQGWDVVIVHHADHGPA